MTSRGQAKSYQERRYSDGSGPCHLRPWILWIDATPRDAAVLLDSYDFLAKRYGTENIISATVHLDKRTPHIHFNFVSVTTDGRLSAKDILTRKSLIEQQTSFFEQVDKKYGLYCGIQGSREKHLETVEYKRQKALERTRELEQDF